MSTENLSNDINKCNNVIDTQNLNSCITNMNESFSDNNECLDKNKFMILKNENIIIKNKMAIIENEIKNINNKWLFVNENEILELLENHRKLVVENKEKVVGEENDKTLAILKEEISNLKNKKVGPKINIIEPKFPKINKDNEIYKLTLRFLNDLLKTMNKPEIMDIIEFTDIARRDLLKMPQTEIIEKYKDEIIKTFGKSKSQYYRKGNYQCYSLALIKIFASNCGYKFKTKEVHKWDITNSMKYEDKCDILYSIIL